MFSEKNLIIISLTVSLVGILSLLLLYHFVELPVEHLAVVHEDRVDDIVRVQGEVLSVRHAKNVTLLTLGEMVERKGVIFDAVNVSEGMEVEVEGTVSMYEGEAELLITSLEVTG